MYSRALIASSLSGHSDAGFDFISVSRAPSKYESSSPIPDLRKEEAETFDLPQKKLAGVEVSEKKNFNRAISGDMHYRLVRNGYPVSIRWKCYPLMSTQEYSE